MGDQVIEAPWLSTGDSWDPPFLPPTTLMPDERGRNVLNLGVSMHSRGAIEATSTGVKRAATFSEHSEEVLMDDPNEAERWRAGLSERDLVSVEVTGGASLLVNESSLLWEGLFSLRSEL